MSNLVLILVVVAVALVLAFVGLPALLAQTPAAPPAPTPPAPGATMPDTPIGRRAAGFLEAFNSGDMARLRDFITTQYAPTALSRMSADARIQTLGRFSGNAGTLSLLAVDRVDDAELTARVQAGRTGERFRMTFEANAAEEHKLVGIQLEILEDDAEPEAAVATGPLSAAAAREEIEGYLAELAKQDEFSGAVLVLRDGAPFVERAFGMADKEKKVANTIDTKFNLGSINKVFTRLAIAQLAESGKISLHEPLIRYLPDYPKPEIAKKVTIAQLAEHTSGLGDIFTDRFEAQRLKLTSLQAFVPLFVDDPLEFEPGTKSSYSNAGFILLGLVIEKVSGLDYYAYVKQNIFAPAGMKDSDSFPLAEATPNRAVGYTRGEDERRPNVPRHPNKNILPARGSSAGGGYSTVWDLARFTKALSENKLAGAAWTSWATGGDEPKAAAPAPSGPIDLGIAGGTPGVNAVLELDPEKGTVVVLSNYDPPSAEQIGRRIRTILGRIQKSGS